MLPVAGDVLAGGEVSQGGSQTEDSSGGARKLAFQPSPTAQALEWAKSTEFFPQELARLTARYGHAVVDEELEIFAFINTVSTSR